MYITVQSQSSLHCAVSAICTGKVPSCISLPRRWVQSVVPSIVIGEPTESLRETLLSTHGKQIVRVIIESSSLIQVRFWWVVPLMGECNEDQIAMYPVVGIGNIHGAIPDVIGNITTLGAQHMNVW
jgi:hypothetical protein